MLTEPRRQQLDAIVQHMVANKESDTAVRLVVDDFKMKYAKEAIEADMSEGKKQDLLSADKYAPAFPAQTGSKMNVARTAGNLPGSAKKFGKGVLSALNPVNVYNQVKEIPGAIKGYAEDTRGALQSEVAAQKLEQKVKTTTGKAAVAKPTDFSTLKPDFLGAAYQGLTPESLQQVFKGDFEGAERTLVNDPFGQVAPLVLGAKGAAESLGKGAAFDAAVSKGAKVVTAPVKAVGSAAKATTKFGISQATGLAPETISQITQNPKMFSKKGMAVNDRASLASEVKTAIDQRLDTLSDTGKGYQYIREGQYKVNLPPNTLVDALSKRGIKLDANGKAIFNKESIPMQPGDKAALQNFLDTFHGETQLSGNAFLNARQALSEMAKFGEGKTNASTVLAKELRAAYDTHGKAQIKGLKELDATYGPEAELMNQIKRDYLKPNGEFKDTALNKLANLTGKGKELVLDRLEQVSPGIGTKIKVLKAIEDIQATGGLKVGTYARNVLTGGLVLATGNIPGAIMTAAASNPAIAVPLIRLYGAAAKASTATINKAVKTFTDSAKKFNESPKLGLSVEDVSAKRGQVADTLNRLKTQRQKLLNQGLSETSAQIKNIDKAVKQLTSPKGEGAIPSTKIDPLIQEAKTIEQKAINTFYETQKAKEGLYITSDGKFIDGTGKNQVSKSEWPYMKDRIVDHREVAQEVTGKSGTDALIEYMNKTRNIRMSMQSDGTLNLDVVAMPTSEQLSAIQTALKQGNGTIIADISGIKGENLASGEFKSFNKYKQFLEDNKSQLTDIWKKANIKNRQP